MSKKGKSKAGAMEYIAMAQQSYNLVDELLKRTTGKGVYEAMQMNQNAPAASFIPFSSSTGFSSSNVTPKHKSIDAPKKRDKHQQEPFTPKEDRHKPNKMPKAGNQPVTVQKDTALTYRKKRVSKRKIRRVKKSYGAFKRNMMRGIPAALYKRFGDVIVTGTAGTQGVASVPGLFSLYGTAGKWDDMNTILTTLIPDADGLLNAPTGTPAIRSDMGPTLIRGRMEMDITNAADTACIVEVYECISRYNSQGSAADPISDLLVAPTVPNGATTLASTVEYVTPFEFRRFTMNYKILNCRKVYLSAGAATDMGSKTYSCKTTGREWNDLSANTRACLPGRTRFWIVIATGAPESDGAGGTRFSDSSLLITSQRTYNVKPQYTRPAMQGYL